MEGIRSPRTERAKQRLSEQLKTLQDAWLRTRFLIVIHRVEGRSPTGIARSLKVSRSMGYRTEQRLWKDGEAGLFDRRDGNGRRKLTEKRSDAVVAGRGRPGRGNC